jgi:hypothetical protein
VFANADLVFFAKALKDLYKDYSPEKVRNIILSNCDSMIEQGARISRLERQFEDDPIKRKEDNEFSKSELGRLSKKDPFPREDDTSEEDLDEKRPSPPRVNQDPNQQALEHKDLLIEQQFNLLQKNLVQEHFKHFRDLI